MSNDLNGFTQSWAQLRDESESLESKLDQPTREQVAGIYVRILDLLDRIEGFGVHFGTIVYAGLTDHERERLSGMREMAQAQCRASLVNESTLNGAVGRLLLALGVAQYILTAYRESASKAEEPEPSA